ncbi:MAG TPA: glycosyltransferase, partial [Phycisphaerae bacterium]|nr:glycosyltransferase [Phycisphaerae bacterium]
HSYRSLVRRILSRQTSAAHVVRPWPTRYPVRWWSRMDDRRLTKMMRESAHRLRRQLEKRCALSAAAAVVVSPMWTPWLDALGVGSVIYDCIDDLAVHAPNPSMLRLYQRWERELVGRVDAAVVTAEVLCAHLAPMHPSLPIELIRNGVNGEWFVKQAQRVARPADMPRAAEGKPVIGFVGALFEWIDWELIHEAARQLPNCQFIFVGPYHPAPEIEALSGMANVHLLGPRPYAEVPAYVRAFDVCWVPFRVGDIAAAANPVKIYEYLALGKPVVTTPVADTASFGSLVRVGKNHAEVIAGLAEALIRLPPDDVPQRQAFARENDWNARARQYVQFMARVSRR